jgi:deoxyuridine 5'-triphosphate nucleotidohydrolase
MRFYISGPMSHIEDNNRAAFAEAESRLIAAGHQAFNPCSLADEEQFAVANSMGAAFRQTREYALLMETCIQKVATCDAMVMLPGWEDSRGAVAERERALMLGLDIYYSLDELCPSIKWIGDSRCCPTKHYSGDAGFDLYVSETTWIGHRDFVDVPLGISIEMPPGLWAMLTGRSSTLRKRHLLVTQGIIDNGFRGELYAGVQNMGREGARVMEGERIAQLIPFRLESVSLPLVQVLELSESDRGTAGFGSTGP